MIDLHCNCRGEGPLVLAALGANLLAFAAMGAAALRGGRWPRVLGAAAFAVAAAAAGAAVAVRWVIVGHVPLQNLYEVFLFLGPATALISLLCTRLGRIGGAAWDAILAAAVLFPVAFVFDPAPRPLPAALRTYLFAPHVAAYMLGYVLAAKAGVQAIAHLAGLRDDAGRMAHEPAAHRLVTLSLPLLTLGLALGCLWGKRAWGDWWNWDPKELWSLATWLIYVGYMHFRHITGARLGRLNAVLVLLGLAAVLLTLLWVNLSRLFPGLHTYAASIA